jgi:hypothetical protein
LVERIAELSTHIEENSYLKDEQGEQDTEKRMASEKSEPQPKRLKSEYLSFYEETMAYTKI